MATNQPSPAELKEALSLLKQLKKGYAELGGVNPFANFNADNIQDIITQAGGVENILTDWTLQLDKVEDNLEGVGKSAKSVYQQFNNIVGELKKTNQNITLGNKSMNAFQKTAEKLKDDQQGITRLSKTELETLQKQNKQAISNLDIANIALQQQIDRNELEGDELTKAQALIDERKAEATAIKDLINLTDNILEKETNINNILNGQMSNLEIPAGENGENVNIDMNQMFNMVGNLMGGMNPTQNSNNNSNPMNMVSSLLPMLGGLSNSNPSIDELEEQMNKASLDDINKSLD